MSTPTERLSSTPTGPLRVVQPDTLDRALPGVNVLADQLETMLDEHRALRATADDNAADPDVRDHALSKTIKLTARIFATWDAAHLVAGAESQARSHVDGILRPYVVDADREARLARPLAHGATQADLDYSSAHNRASSRLRSLVRDLAARGYATEKKALP